MGFLEFVKAENETEPLMLMLRLTADCLFDEVHRGSFDTASAFHQNGLNSFFTSKILRTVTHNDSFLELFAKISSI